MEPKTKLRIDLTDLKRMFVGRAVRVVDEKNPDFKPIGICYAISASRQDGIIVQLYGVSLGFIPDTLTSNTVEGMAGEPAYRRKMELLNDVNVLDALSEEIEKLSDLLRDRRGDDPHWRILFKTGSRRLHELTAQTFDK